MERVRRLSGNGLQARPTLTTPALTPHDLRVWSRYASSSPLYLELVYIIAENPDLLSVLNAMENLPRPNMLFAGVQYLLMKDPTDPLAGHYPNIGGEVADEKGLASEFRRFVSDHRHELIEIGRTRYTQTNECRRCTALLPAIWHSGLTSFHLIDVGTSAGLNLHLDRYHYLWGDVAWGPDSTVRLEAQSLGAEIVPRDIEILSRTGLDLHPIDPEDPDHRLWLSALIWPEHESRRERLRAALDLAASHPVELVGGDSVDTLGVVLDGLSPGEPAVVMHAFALNQFTEEGVQRYSAILEAQRSERPVVDLWLEAIGRHDGSAGIAIDDGSGLVELGRAHPHGEWVEFYARP